jgi:DNA-binding XRE family transcriptional regulator
LVREVTPLPDALANPGEVRQMHVNIKEARCRAGVTVTEAAAMADVSPTSWRVWEANQEAVRESVAQRCAGAALKILEIAGRAA